MRKFILRLIGDDFVWCCIFCLVVGVDCDCFKVIFKLVFWFLLKFEFNVKVCCFRIMGEFGRDWFWVKLFKLFNWDSVGECVVGRCIFGEGILKFVELEVFFVFMVFVVFWLVFGKWLMFFCFNVLFFFNMKFFLEVKFFWW